MELHEKRKCKCTQHTGDESWHGKPGGYYRHYCRCRGCSEAGSAASRAWRQANPERARAQKSRWRAANPERDREIGRAYENRNKGARLAKGRAWHAENPAAVRRLRTQRKALIVAVDSTATRRGPWSRAEELVALRADLTAVDIARLLGRTVQSAQQKRLRLREAAADA